MIEFMKILSDWTRSPHDECVEELVQVILDKKPSNEKLQNFYIKTLRPLFSDRNAGGEFSVNRKWIVFVDGIDEALTDYSESHSILSREIHDIYSDDNDLAKKNAILFAQQLWTNAQAGYAIAAFQLKQKTNGQLVAFGAMRNETLSHFVRDSGLTDLKVEHFIYEIDYEDQVLRDIFNYNIKLMSPSHKVMLDEDVEQKITDTRIELCGYKELYNRTVFGIREDIYSLISRHTFSTPRGIVSLGGTVADVKLRASPSGTGNKKWRDPDAIFSAVNKYAIRVLKEYLDNVFPPWDTRYESGYSLIKHNIMNEGDVLKINEAFRAENPELEVSLFDYLFQYGLVGYPSQDTSGEVVQKFSFDLDGIIPVGHGFLMVHPALSSKIHSILPIKDQLNYFDSRMIVNPGRCCPITLKNTVLHVSICKHDRTKLQVQWRDSKQLIVDQAIHACDVFLIILIIAMRFCRSSHVGKEQIVNVGKVLSSEGYIPDKLGRPKINIDDYFEKFCSYEEHGTTADQPGPIAEIKSKLSDVTSGELKISIEFRKDGLLFGLEISDGENGYSRLEPQEVLVDGLKFPRAVLHGSHE